MIHLLIMNGPEQRNFILERTIQICKPYFDSIRILQNGGSSNSGIVNEYTIRWSNEFVGYTEGLDILKEGIPNGDWIFLLDSDERPQQSLLNFIRDVNSGQFLTHANTISFPFRHHSITDEGKIYGICGHETGFVCNRMFKIEDGLKSGVHASAHFGFIQDNPLVFQTTHFINHFKHDFAYKFSSLSYGLAYPDSISITPEMWEYEVLTSVRQLLAKSVDEINISKCEITPSTPYLYYFLSSWSEIDKVATVLNKSESGACRDIAQIVEFLSKNKKSLDELYRHQKCSQSCCEYVVQY